MKMKSFILLLCLGTGVLANAQTAPAPDTTGIHYAASLAANAGGGDFAVARENRFAANGRKGRL